MAVVPRSTGSPVSGPVHPGSKVVFVNIWTVLYMDTQIILSKLTARKILAFSLGVTE